LLTADEWKEQSTNSRMPGKGDLLFDRVLVFIRDGKAKWLKEGEAVDLQSHDPQPEDTTVYDLPDTPCKLLVTTAEGGSYELTVLSATDGEGMNLEYRRVGQSEAERRVRMMNQYARAELEAQRRGLEAEKRRAEMEADIARVREQDLESHKLWVWFGPVIKQTITAEDRIGIDFDKGKVLKIPDLIRKQNDEHVAMRWVRDNGIDAGLDQELIAIDMAVQKLYPKAWESISPGQLKAIAGDGPTAEVPAMDHQTMPHAGIYPATYAFRTRENGIGILQILDIDEKNGVTVQYRMLDKDFTSKSPVDVNSTNKWKVGTLAESPNRKLVDEATLKTVISSMRSYRRRGWLAVEEVYEVASQNEKQQMIEDWIAQAKGSSRHNISPQRQRKAVASLGNVGAKQAVDVLIKLIEPEKPKDPLEIPSAMNASHSTLPWARRLAIRALGRIGDIKAVPSVIRYLGPEEEKMFKDLARVALAEITGVYFGDDKAKWQKWWDETGSKQLKESSEE